MIHHHYHRGLYLGLFLARQSHLQSSSRFKKYETFFPAGKEAGAFKLFVYGKIVAVVQNA